MTFTALDHIYMAQALRLAERGLYSTTPNPRVGCVIVKDDKIVGKGAHLKAGEPHAEVFALREAGALAKGATAYVTLEPCSHQGRTPPCANALVEAGIRRVITAMVDPNPLVAGNGLKYLNQHGITTNSGLMQAQASALNAGFIKRMQTNMPYVRSKIAASLDGRTALSNGISQWITADAARQDVQHWRAQSCAIITGIGTVLADNPQMTVRAPHLIQQMQGRQPLKVVVDSQLRISSAANILQGNNTLIAYATDPNQKRAGLLDKQVSLLQVPNDHQKVCLKSLLSHLATLGVNEVLLEGGQGINGAFLSLQLIDELILYYAPSIMGADARGMFNMPAFTQMTQKISLEITDTRLLGKDLRLLAKPIY